MDGQFVFFLVVLLVVSIVAYVRHQQEKERAAALAAYCASRGWQYWADDPYGLDDRWDGAPFGIGSRRRVRNVIRADLDGRAFVAFDY